MYLRDVTLWNESLFLHIAPLPCGDTMRPSSIAPFTAGLVLLSYSPGTPLVLLSTAAYAVSFRWAVCADGRGHCGGGGHRRRRHGHGPHDGDAAPTDPRRRAAHEVGRPDTQALYSTIYLGSQHNTQCTGHNTRQLWGDGLFIDD